MAQLVSRHENRHWNDTLARKAFLQCVYCLENQHQNLLWIPLVWRCFCSLFASQKLIWIVRIVMIIVWSPKFIVPFVLSKTHNVVTSNGSRFCWNWSWYSCCNVIFCNNLEFKALFRALIWGDGCSWLEFFSFNIGGSRISTEVGRQPLGGRQHTILPNFAKNCMKFKEFAPREGSA